MSSPVSSAPAPAATTEEKKWLDAFRALNDAGKFQKYILDKKEGRKWLDDVEARAARLAAMPAAILKNPVTLTAMQSNDGWMLTLGFVTVQLEYADGTLSEVKKFAKP